MPNSDDAPALVAPPEDGFRYDLFLSYRHQAPDKTWVRRALYPGPHAEGFRACLDVVDFRLGVPIVNEMERAALESRDTAPVLTTADLAGHFTDFENVIAQHLGLEQGERRVFDLMREPCSPRLGLRALAYHDMTDDAKFDAAFARLAADLREPTGPNPAAT